MALAQHISRRFDEDLEGLRSRVLAMGGLAQEQVAEAVNALVSGDSERGLQVAHDDHKVNDMEVAIDEECNRILARRSPAAGDLRLIVAIIKTITDIERIGDEAEKIGFLASRLAAMERPSNNYREIGNLGRHVGQMIHSALDAFARLDTAAAVEVVRADGVVDEEYELISRQSITYMMENPRNIRRILDVMWAARALERVGDHAKNIGEYVIYMVQGQDVRHTGLSRMEEAARDGGGNED